MHIYLTMLGLLAVLRFTVTGFTQPGIALLVLGTLATVAAGYRLVPGPDIAVPRVATTSSLR